MTLKRENDEQDNPNKRVRRMYSQFPQNLFRFGPSPVLRSTSDRKELESCASCRSAINCTYPKCNFCENMVCVECQLNCLRCQQLFCRSCAIKNYSTNRDDVGICFSCQ